MREMCYLWVWLPLCYPNFKRFPKKIHNKFQKSNNISMCLTKPKYWLRCCWNLRMQSFPFECSLNPFLQLHLNPPSVFLHSFSHPPSFIEHSSISVIKPKLILCNENSLDKMIHYGFLAFSIIIVRTFLLSLVIRVSHVIPQFYLTF